MAPTLAFAGVLAALLTATAALTRDVTSALLCATALGTVMLLLLAVVVRRNYDLFEPLSFVILSVLVGTTLKALYVAFSDSEQVTRILLNESPDVLLTGSVFVLLGLLALVTGYSFRLPTIDFSHWPLMRRPYWDRNVLTPVVGSALLISVSAFLYWFSSMGIEVSSLVQLSQKRFIAVEGSAYDTGLPYLGWAVSVAGSAFYVLLSWHLVATRPMPWLARLALPLSGLIALAFPIFKSSRTGMAEVVLIILILLHYLRPGIRYRTIVLALPTALIAFLGVTAVRGRRDVHAAEARITAQTLLNTTIGSRNFLDVAKTSHIIEAVPKTLAPANGATFLRWVTAPIPRKWWPEKPSLGPGPLIGAEVYGTTAAAVPPGFVAELYMNFGAIGVPVGMFLLGALLRAVYGAFSAYRRNPNAVLLYAVTIVPISFGLLQTDFSKTVVNVLMGTLPLALLLRAMARDRRGETTT